MAAGVTYTPIASYTFASAAANYTFTSIPQSYTNLVLVCNAIAESTAFHIYCQLNSDTASNYSDTGLYGDGTSAASWRDSTQTQCRLTYAAAVRTTSPTTVVTNFQNYTNATTYKTLLTRESRASDGAGAIVGVWRATPAAITSIKLYTSTANFGIGTVMSLYGIAAA
jgi:hypothetical protein